MQTCVDEVEKRGLSEVGVYRVVGVLRDVEELRLSFDSGKDDSCNVSVPLPNRYRSYPSDVLVSLENL